MARVETRDPLPFLLQLLDDESAEIQRILREEILNHAVDIVMDGRSIRDGLPGGDRGKFDELLAALRMNIVARVLQEIAAASRDELDLEAGMLALAWWGDPRMDALAVRGDLDRLARRVGKGMPRSGHPLGFVDHINRVLFREEGFKGNSAEYYNPENSYLHRVLESRRGIPITLSALHMLVAQRLRFPVVGVALPAHFIMKFDNGVDEIFFDPFHGGKIYSRKTVLDYLSGFEGLDTDAVLRGCSSKEILIRMLRNLHVVFSSHHVDPGKVTEIEHLLVLLTGNAPLAGH